MTVHDDLKAFVDGELDSQRSREIQEAIDADPSLRMEADMIRSIGESIRAFAARPVPAGAYESPRRAGWRWWNLALAGVAGTLLVVVLFPIFAQPKEGSRRLSLQSMGRDRVDSGVAEAPSAAMPSRGGAGFEAKSEANTSAAAPPTANREIVRTANLTSRVEDAYLAQAEAERIATRHGGFVESSQSSRYASGYPVATVGMRVPVARFDAALRDLRAMGDVVEQAITGEDVTAQTADLDARLRTLRGEEEQYLLILRSARKIGEVLEVRERLGRVRQEIESLEAQRKTLRTQAAMSTITATFEQKAAPRRAEEEPNWSSDAWNTASAGLSAAFRWLGQAAIYAFVYSPLWLPAGLAVWWISRRRR